MSQLACRVCGEEYSQDRRLLGYDYCMDPQCVREAKKPLVIISVAQNKAASALNILNPETEEESRTKLRDVRRSVVKPEGRFVARGPALTQTEGATRRVLRGPGLPGTPKQQRLVHIYKESGDRPKVIAEKTELSLWAVNKILQSKMRRTL